MLKSVEIAERLVEAAEISREEKVLEIGTGTGILTALLSRNARVVNSFEIDPILSLRARESLSLHNNVNIICGDAFAPMHKVGFDVCVASLPYSQSLKFVRWLSLRSGEFSRCVVIFQSEFVDKITSKPGRDSYRAVSVIAEKSFVVEKLFPIDRSHFDPPPRVVSDAVKIFPRRDNEQPFFNESRIRLLNELFSFRSRKLAPALKKLEKRLPLPSDLLNNRIEDLTPNQFGELILGLEALRK